MHKKVFERAGGARKPAGGFCFISGTALLRAWEAYRSDEIRLFDLRAWFACHEIVARRCGVGKGRVPRYRFDEIQTLVGGSRVSEIRGSIRRLERAGLVHWSEASIRFPSSTGEDGHGFPSQMLSLVKNHNRLVPVPRRIIRRVASGERRVFIATVLGHLLRCMYYRNGQCLPEGRCKASWIASVFGVDSRSVKQARKQLVAMGWLMLTETHQNDLNRWGARVEINLAWRGGDSAGNDSTRSVRLSPPPAQNSGKPPPPEKNKELSLRSNNQKPAALGPAGAYASEGQGGAPTLRNVTIDDLKKPARCEKLRAQAVMAGLISSSESDRLKVFSAAEHALAVGTRNPSGLFVAVLRRGLWSFITQRDEDRARATLNQLQPWEGRGTRTTMASSIPRGAQLASKGPHVTDRTEIRALIRRSLGLTDFGNTEPRARPNGACSR